MRLHGAIPQKAVNDVLSCRDPRCLQSVIYSSKGLLSVLNGIGGIGVSCGGMLRVN
jgi:hypothetical protein